MCVFGGVGGCGGSRVGGKPAAFTAKTPLVQCARMASLRPLVAVACCLFWHESKHGPALAAVGVITGMAAMTQVPAWGSVWHDSLA